MPSVAAPTAIVIRVPLVVGPTMTRRNHARQVFTVAYRLCGGSSDVVRDQDVALPTIDVAAERPPAVA